MAQSKEFPYTVTVVGEDAVVRSGPGASHYGTDRLAPGSKVEIYRHDPGGWMAIRPPKGSFSLIQRDEVELDDKGQATVLEDDTLAWVGTRLSAVDKPMFQVKLRAGEVLNVLGVVDREKFKLDEDQPDWVQIEPPRGEFRWISSQNIEGSQPNQEAVADPGLLDSLEITSVDDSKANVARGPVPFETWGPKKSLEAPVMKEWVNAQTTAQANPSSMPSNGATANQPVNSVTGGWKPARQTISNFVDEPSRFIADAENPTSIPGDGFSAGGNGLAGNANPSMPADIFNGVANPPRVAQVSNQTSATLLAPTFGNPQLESLEMRLTQEMLKPPAQWNLMPLAAETEQFRGQITNQSDMDRWGQLIEKIRKCREIQAGYRATGEGAPVDLQTMRNRGYAVAPVTNPNQTTGNLLYNYDAHGYLNQLARNGLNGPETYVLQNENGVITHHVTAPPGLNLRPFMNQRVGIIGNRGFHQQLQLNHVTAERVIALDSLRR